MRTTLKLVVLSTSLFALPLAAADAVKSVFKSAIESSLTAATGKVGQLLGAFSEEQLAWRPSDKVQTVREVILHVAAGNYFLSSKLGATLPAGMNLGELAGPTATKAELQAILDKSVEFALATLAGLPDAEMEAPMEFFGQKSTRMRFVVLTAEHAHEHLGQLIAYARSNDVVPPWSQ